MIDETDAKDESCQVPCYIGRFIGTDYNFAFSQKMRDMFMANASPTEMEFLKSLGMI